MNPYLHHTDPELVDLLNAGNERAFEAVYRRYVGEMYRLARRNISVSEDCEEMVQDVFESLWARHQEIKVDSLRHYLRTSIRYKLIRYFYNKGVKKRYVDHYTFFEVLYESAEPEARNPETLRDLLLKGLEGLPDRCRAAIKLRITEDLSNGEIAERMNITKKTVELYMSKALAHLRATFPELYKANN